MIAFIAKRIGAGISLLVVIPTITFFLMFSSTGGVARQILGENASPKQVAEKAAELGLTKPLYQQFFDYVAQVAHGNLGASWYTNEPVSNVVTSRVAITLTIVIGAVLISTIIAYVLGVAAAVRRGWLDVVLQILAIAGFAVPGFWLALLLVSTFALQLPWFPATGFISFTDSIPGWASSITLPIAALSIGAVAGIAQQVRGSAVDVLRQDYVRTLRSRGLPTRRILTHVVRNASGPALTTVALTFVGTLGGAVFIERIFALPGMGLAAVTATTQGDIPVVMGVVLVTTVIVVLVNLAIDIVVGLLNPKVRLS